MPCQDSPPGYNVTVRPCRSGQKGSCLECFYINRGSFKKVPAGELATKLEENPSLRDKLLGLSQWN